MQNSSENGLSGSGDMVAVAEPRLPRTAQIRLHRDLAVAARIVATAIEREAMSAPLWVAVRRAALMAANAFDRAA